MAKKKAAQKITASGTGRNAARPDLVGVKGSAKKAATSGGKQQDWQDRYEQAGDKKRAKMDAAREEKVTDRLQRARKNNNEERVQALRQRRQAINARQAQNPALGGTGWSWQWDRNPATGKPVAAGPAAAPADPNEPPEEVEEDTDAEAIAQARKELDVYLSNAWTNPADREVLVNLLTSAIRNKDLYVNSDNFQDQVWQLLETTDQYKARFPGLVARKNTSANGQVPVSPLEYMKMEDMFDAALRTYMIPPGVMDRRTAIAKMVENDVTVEEMQARIDLAAMAATEDQSFMKKFSEYQGMTPGHLIAFYLDPELTAQGIERQERMFKVGAMMDKYGFQGAKQDAETLVNLGVTSESAASTLDRAASQRNLMTGLGATATESEVLRGSAQEGASAQMLQNLRAQRQGRFNTSGGAAETQQGVSGLGSARST